MLFQLHTLYTVEFEMIMSCDYIRTWKMDTAYMKVLFWHST